MEVNHNDIPNWPSVMDGHRIPTDFQRIFGGYRAGKSWRAQMWLDSVKAAYPDAEINPRRQLHADKNSTEAHQPQPTFTHRCVKHLKMI